MTNLDLNEYSFMSYPAQCAPGIQLKQASVFYPAHIIFSNLDLTLDAGKWTGLLGKSGIGKSSLLRLIAGFIDPQNSLFELTTSDQAPLTSRIAYLPQQDTLLPWLNVLDNVLIGFRLRTETRHLTALKERALHLLEKVELSKVINQKPDQLSGGQRQRVTLVRTFMEERPVILMDEPFAQLDAVTRLSLQTLAAELFKHKTVLLVTHDPLEALRLSHSIYIMSGSPACLHKIPHLPDSQTPRSLSDPELLYLQGQLLATLQTGHPYVQT